MTLPYDLVCAHINQAVNVAVQRVTERKEELFTSEIVSSGNGGASPFQKILLPEAKIFSSFERSLSASLGKSFDYIAADIAKATYGNGEHDYHLSGQLSQETLSAIEKIVARYKAKKGERAMPNTPAEIEELAQVIESSQATIKRTIKSDVVFTDHEGFNNFLEIKTVQPNYDTCDKVKTRILTIHAMHHGITAQKVRALAVFPHNPNGLVGHYSWPPLRYFLDPEYDWKARGKKLMGPGLWNFIGNSEDTYDELLDCFYDVSIVRKDEILNLLSLSVE
ncbi:MAG: TdeIII family type II restriction endonuclease [Cyanothece sp. SIO2G6]|nr:TdeIII family type II restriction endonuclease [Cyanothece sp. SIO2G6]